MNDIELIYDKFRKRLEKCHTHWHPQTIEQAIKDVDEFMLGKHPFIK